MKPHVVSGKMPAAAIPACHAGCAGDPLRQRRGRSWLVGGGGLGLVVGAA
jgi:hypothetical protein